MMLKCWGNTLKPQFGSYVTAVNFFNLINFQNNLTWPNSNTPETIDSGLKYSKITNRYTENFPQFQ